MSAAEAAFASEEEEAGTGDEAGEDGKGGEEGGEEMVWLVSVCVN